MKKQQSLSRISHAALALLATAGILTFAGGCSLAHRDETPVLLIIAIDTSGSAAPDLIKYRRFAFALIRDLRPDHDGLRVIRFDHDVHEVLSKIGHKKKVLLQTLAAQLQVPASRSSTRMAKLYERIVEIMDLPEAQGKRIEIVILSDNGNDDASAEMADLLQRSTERIATNPNLSKVTYWGVKPRLAEGIPTAFRELPAGTLSVQFNSEAFARK